MQGHLDNPNPLHDIYFWLSSMYIQLIVLYFLNLNIGKVWDFFKLQNEKGVRISQKIRETVLDAKTREKVREKMLGAEIRINKASEFQKLFWFHSPHHTYTFIKIAIMFTCWTTMMYIIGFSRTIWDRTILTPGHAVALTVFYFLPALVLLIWLIPGILSKMTIVMSAKDLSLASKKEKAVLLSQMSVTMSEEKLTVFRRRRPTIQQPNESAEKPKSYSKLPGLAEKFGGD